MIKTDRSLLKYIILNIITCGICRLWFIHRISEDINIICDGDGKNTSGLLKLILLSIITCGIYILIWYYKLGNRLVENAYRYNLYFSENGTSIVLWMTL